MIDTVLKGDGTAFALKATANKMPSSYSEWRNLVLNGTARMDISLDAAGCEVVGTPLNKETLLPKSVQNILSLSDASTVGNALSALYVLALKPNQVSVTIVSKAGATVKAHLTQEPNTYHTFPMGTNTTQTVRLPSPGEWQFEATFGGKTYGVTKTFVAGEQGRVCISDDLNAMSWAEILSAVKYAETSTDKAVPWALGATKAVRINFKNTNAYYARLVTYNPGSNAIFHLCIPLWGNAFSQNLTATTAGGYMMSRMRTEILPTIFGILPNDLQSALESSNTLTSAAPRATIFDALFLPSEKEIFGTSSLASSSPGSQFQWYASGNSPIAPETAGTNGGYWLRDPVDESETTFAVVSSNGAVGSMQADSSVGVAPCFQLW